jgi:Acetyltransferase (GNAT) domain
MGLPSMQPIIPPVDRSIIESELTAERFIRETNKGDNLIYIVNNNNAPHVLREIGRVREITFRNAGGGTGLDCDLDNYDIGPYPYEQLVVWNPDDREIVGGYRFICCGKTPFVNSTAPHLATAELFEFSEKFLNEFLPHTIELGRSFVQPQYQPSHDNRKGLFSLDNLWDGLGSITVDHPEIKYFFGKVTMYRHFNAIARDMILFFMNHYFPDPDRLVWPRHPLPVLHDMSAFQQELKNLPYKEGHHVLNQRVRSLGENIPPLFNSYMNLSATMRTFGTSLNDHFGEVEETGILVTISDIFDSKKERHIASYHPRR